MKTYWLPLVIIVALLVHVGVRVASSEAFVFSPTFPEEGTSGRQQMQANRVGERQADSPEGQVVDEVMAINMLLAGW